MLRYLSVVAVLVALTTAPDARAAIVSANIVTAVEMPVPAGSTVPYDIHLVISDLGDATQSAGLCLFAIDLHSDLGVDQPPVQSFSLRVASNFTAISPLFGTPNADGGLSAISAAQDCGNPAVLGVGLPGDSLIASGELRMPSVPGQYSVQVVLFQVQLLQPEGGGPTPTTTNSGTLTITVGQAVDGSDGDGEDNTDPPAEASTGGIDDGGAGTGGLGGDGTTNGSDGNGGEGDDGAEGGDVDTSGAGAGISSGDVLTGDPVQAEPVSSDGLCGFGMLGPLILGLTALWGLRAARRTYY